MRRFPTRTALLATTVGMVLAASSGAGVASAGGTRPARAPSPGHWTRVTSAGLENFTSIGLVRGPNGVLHVIWTQPSGPPYTVWDTPIAGNGAVQKRVAISSRLDQASFPDATASSDGLHAFWNEISNSTPQAITGTAQATWPKRDRHWDPVTGVSPADQQLLGLRRRGVHWR